MRTLLYIAVLFLFLITKPTIGQIGFSLDINQLIDEGRVTAEHTNFDIGNLERVFDDDGSSLARTPNISPLVIVLTFEDPITITASSVIKSYGNGSWILEIANSQSDLDTKTDSYQQLIQRDITIPVPDVYLGLTDSISFSPVTTKIIRLSIIKDDVDDFVHLNDWVLSADCSAPNNSGDLPCSDEDPFTYSDSLNSSCICEGTPYPSGTFCFNAIVISDNGTYQAEGPGFGNGSYNKNDGGVNANWFSFTPSSNGKLTVSSCNGGVDTRLFLYEGTCTNLSLLASSDDACPIAPDGSPYASEIQYLVELGKTYYIEWDNRWSVDSFSFTFDLQPLHTSSPCRQTDSLALIALYNSTDGPNWTNTWDLTLPIEFWHGVITNQFGCVSVLDLRENELAGTIPSDIGNLTDLQELELDRNQLNGTIPTDIGNLTNLQELELDRNHLIGTIPTDIGNLTNLQVLELDRNQLNGAIPTEIGNLINLQVLDLNRNQLNGKIPTEIGNLINLHSLDLGFNQLNGAIPAEIINLANLQSLYLDSNQLNGKIPTEIGNLTKLHSLFLNSNQLNGKIPTEIGNLINLETLTMYSNQLNGTIPTEIGNLTKLHSLFLSSNQLNGKIPTEIGNLTNLQELHLANNNLSGCIPQSLSNLCDIAVNLGDNPNLPNGGDFSAFCDTQSGACPAVCTAVEMPADGEQNVALTPTLSWPPAPDATGYLLNIGTTPGGSDVADMLDQGPSTTYSPALPLQGGTTYYVQVQPYNGDGTTTICTETSFTTTIDGVCQDVDLQLHETPIEAITHQTSKSITSSGTVENGSEVTFQAAQSVTLTPGFSAEAGSSFLARIDDCSPAIASEVADTSIAEQARTAFTTERNQTIATERMEWRIVPNPMTNQAVIEYTLPYASRASINVFDLMGRKMVSLIEPSLQEQGTYEVFITSTSLPGGIYVVQLRMEGAVYQKRIIVSK